MNIKNSDFLYKMSKSPWLRRGIVMLVLAVMLVLPVGEAFAAGLLRMGSRGQEVTQVQQELKNRGYFTHWRTTDYFGSITQSVSKPELRCLEIKPRALLQ